MSIGTGGTAGAEDSKSDTVVGAKGAGLGGSGTDETSSFEGISFTGVVGVTGGGSRFGDADLLPMIFSICARRAESSLSNFTIFSSFGFAAVGVGAAQFTSDSFRDSLILSTLCSNP